MGSAIAAVALGALAAALLALAAAAAIAAALFARGFATSERHAMYVAPRRRLSELYDRLRTGDLLLFASATNLCYAGTFFSHAAVVVRKSDLAGRADPGAEDLVYVAESTAGAPVTPRDPTARGSLGLGATARAARGAGLTPLLPRLRWYTGSVYVSRLDPPLDPAAAAALAAAAAERVPYPGEGAALAGLAREALGAPPSSGSRHCFAHVAHLLAAAGLRAGELRAAGFAGVCRAVCALPGARAAPGEPAYAEPELVVYDF